MPQLNPTFIGKQLILSSSQASARAVLGLATTDSPTFVDLTASGRVYAGTTNNYFDNPTSGGGRWQTPFAGTYTFQQNQSGQSMTVQLATSELRLAGLKHWDVAHANGRRLDLFSQAAVPITVRPAGVLAMTWDTSGNTTASGTVTASSTITAPFFRDSTNQANYFGGGINARNTWLVAYSNDGTDFGTKDVSFSRAGVGILQIGDGTANALGSLNLTNLTASGTINANGGIVMPTSGGYIIGSGAASFSIGDTNDTIAFNAGTNLFASPITLTSGGPLLRNNAGTIEARNNANSAQANIAASQFTGSFFRDATNQANYFGHGINARNTWLVAYSNDGTDFGTKDVSFSRAGVGILQIGNGTSNALGSLNLTNLTASGTVTSLEQIFTNGANSTRIARASGANGRTIVYRPNNGSAIAVQFGGGNDELAIGQGGEGSFKASGSNVQVGSSGNLFLDSGANSFTFRGSASTTMATLTGVGNLSTVGTITYSEISFPELVTNGGFDTDTAWAKGTGWTISGGLAVATGVVSFADINQNIPAVVLGQTYIITFTVVVTSGSIAGFLGNSGSSFAAVTPNVATSGTYTFLFHKNSGDTAKTLLFRANATFTGTIDNVSLKRAF